MLWLCALLALTASTFLLSARADGLVTRQRAGLAQARAAADAGVSLAVIGISGAAPEGAWPRDGRVVVAEFGGATLHIAVQDELGLVDVNQGSADLLAGLFQAVGASGSASRSAAAGFIRWRDPPDAARRTVADVEDLVRLPAIPAGLFRRAAPFLTVRNGTAAIDPVTAPRPVLRGLPDMPAGAADSMVTARAQASVLPGSLPLLNDPDQQGPPLHRFVMIRAESRVASGISFIREAEVELQPDPETAYRVLVWRQSTLTLAGS